MVDVVIINPAGTGCDIALLVDAVHFAINLIPGHNTLATSEIGGTLVIADTYRALVPLSGNQLAVRLKFVSNITVEIGGNGGIGSLVEVVPVIINRQPAAGQGAGDGVVTLAVDDMQAGDGGLSAAVADQLAVLNAVGMTGGRNGSAPLDHRVTALTEGSAGVARLSTGGFFIFKRHRSMYVGGTVCCEVLLIHIGHAGIHLGIHMELLVGEGIQHIAGIGVHIGDLAHVNIHFHVLRPEGISSPVGLCGVAGRLDIGIEVQDPDGQLRQNGYAVLDIVAGTGNGNGCSVSLFRDGIFSGKALSQFHVVQLPVVDIVQVDHRGNGLNCFDISCLQVHPVDGAEGDPVQGRVSGNHVDGRSLNTGFNLDNADDNRLVTCIVADLELHTVVAVCNSDVIGGHNTVCIGGGHLNTVNVDLSGAGVQAGGVVQGNFVLVSVQFDRLVRHSSGEVQDIAAGGDHIALHQSGSSIQIDLADNRILSVVHGFGIVHGEVIQIVGVITIDGAVLLPQLVVDGLVEDNRQEELAGFTGHAVGGVNIVLLVSLQGDLGERTDVHGQVMPAGFVDVIVYVLRLHHADNVIRIEDTVAIGVSLIMTLHPALDVILGNIEPEANGTGVFKDECLSVHTQTDPGILLGVGICRGQSVGLQTHGVIAIMDLTIGAVRQGQSQLIIPMGGVLSVVDHIPLVNICLATLKVPKHLGGLAQIQLYSGAWVSTHIQGCRDGTSQIIRHLRLVHGGKIQPNKSTECLICGGKGHVV